MKMPMIIQVIYADADGVKRRTASTALCGADTTEKAARLAAQWLVTDAAAAERIDAQSNPIFIRMPDGDYWHAGEEVAASPAKTVKDQAPQVWQAHKDALREAEKRTIQADLEEHLTNAEAAGKKPGPITLRLTHARSDESITIIWSQK